MPPEVYDTVIVCIGNELIADDAAGYEVYQKIRNLPARVEYCSVGGINLLPLLNGEKRLIVVDAVELGAPAGTLHCIPFAELPSSSSHISAHGLGIRESIEIGRILYPEQMPEQIVLVGIEGRCFNRTKEFISPEVAAKIDDAVTVIEELVKGEKA